MTSWSAAGSPVRYYQCPFCGRTHSSPYSEVFHRGAGARFLEPRPTAGGIPEATPEAVEWAGIKSTAARWFARLDADEQRLGVVASPASHPAHPARGHLPIPLVDSRDVVELRPLSRGRRAR